MLKRLIVNFLAVVAGLVVCNMDVCAAVGRTPGQFAVSATGDAQYSITIWAPPGPRGIQPNISLFYDHQSPIGPLGLGWSIGGLGSITRCNLTVAQDGVAAPVALVVSDGYCVNGKRLRLTSGTYGTSGSVYQTEIADFSQITANGTAGNGPQYFVVQGRNGLTYYYGYTDNNGNGANSQVLANGTTTALTWLLSKVADRAGNNYVINYTALTGTAVPNDILWTPTSAGASTYAYKMLFNYTTNVPQSSIHQYVAGTLVSNTQLLSSIEIFWGTTVVKDYFLGYQASPVTGREELTSITECADSGKTNCLAATNVGYQQTGTVGLSSTANTAVSSVSSLLTTRYDLNGDGYPDLIYNPTGIGAWYVAFGSASGYGTPVNTGATGYALFGNLTGGSQDGLLVDVSGTWWYYTWNGSSFTGTSLGIAFDSSTYGYQLADINGDGLPDLIDLSVVYSKGDGTSTATMYTRLNTSQGSTASYSSTTTTALTLGNVASAQLGTPDLQYGKLRRYDFNGDGRDDVVLMTVRGTSPNFSIYTYELLATGTGLAASLIASVPAINYVPVYFTNWNDDKCTDFVSFNVLYVSACNGTVAETYPIAGTLVAALDWDGDGRTDILVANGSTLGVYLSKATGAPSLTATSIPYTATCQYVWMDANGDDLDDLGCWSQTGSAPLTYYLHNGSTDLASSFVDGFGNSIKPIYNTINQPGGNYTASSAYSFPYQPYIGPLFVVTNVTFSDPSTTTGATYYQNFSYKGAWVNVQGRGFMGFEATQSYDSRNSVWDTTDFGIVFPSNGMTSSRITAQDNLNTKPIVAVNATLSSLTLATTANNQRYFPYTTLATTNVYEVSGVKNTQLITTIATNNGTPDNYGNFGTVTNTVTDEDSGSPYYGVTWSTTTANTVTAQTGSTWCLNLPTQTAVTDSSTAVGGSAITRTVTYTPDYANCRETGKVTEPSSSLYKVSEAYSFDSFGNVYTDTVTGVGMAARVTTSTWGTTGQFLTTIQRPLTPSITLGYDYSKGVLTSQTDPNYASTNPLQTTWVYDGFARKTQENRPDGTYTTWSYNDCATDGGCLFGAHAVAQGYDIYGVGGTLINDGTTYYDTVDRPIMQNAKMISSYSRNEVRYDSLGRVVQQAMPCTYTAVVTPCPYWSTVNFDMVNRVTQAQRPISASNSTLQTTVYKYAGRTSTVTDALGNTSSKITLVNGRLARTQDPKGYFVNLAYDAFGSLTLVTDAASNTLFTANYAYGLDAFPTSSTDMDLGTRSYTVDALGEVTGYSDAKGQSFTQTYDALSRPLVRTDLVTAPDLVTTWTWGSSAATYSIGKLQSVAATGSNGTYSESYAFDNLTRLQTKSISVPADSTYTYTYTYNASTGFPNTLTYPSSTAGYSLALQYGYTNGILQQVKDANSSTVFWQNSGMNPRGQVTQETLGNGIVTNRAYDAVTGWVASIQSGVGGGAGIQNQSFLFDVDGNVTQRQDNNLGLTENFYYDADNRLDHSALNGTVNLQMTYDGGTPGPGNITARSDVASGTTWTYDPVRKHAVTQAGTGGYAFTYDANGNATSRNGYAITWSSYNYPTSINGLYKNLALYYGPNRQYYKQVYSNGSSIENTIYAGGLLEKLTLGSLVDWRHYIRVNNELVAIVSRQSSGTNLTHYVLSDHQGSIAKMTDGSAATTVSESFSAFGARRNPSTWSGMPTCPDLCTITSISREGYTGHDAMGGVSMGLNHMNGRVEDAITGRFLSPDPYVPNAGNTQDFNRYSYVNNNPLTFVDSSGFDECLDIDGLCPITIDPNVGYILPGITVSSGSTVTSDGVPGQYVITAPDGGLTIVSVGNPGSPKSSNSAGSTNNAQPPTATPIVPEAQILPVAQSPKSVMTPCPNSGLANFLYGLNSAGQNTVSAGKVTTAAAAGLATVAAPFLLTPAAPEAAAVEGFAGIGATVGTATTLTGYVMQDAAGLGLAALGDAGPLLNTSFSVLNSIGLSVTGNSPPSITPVNPFSSTLNNMEQSISSCGAH